MTNAMLFTGLGLDSKGLPRIFRVEVPLRDNGPLVMTKEFFQRFVYAVVIDKGLLNSQQLKVSESEPISLPAWDPMGNLLK